MTSRRGADAMVTAKRVTVNGQTISDFSFQVLDGDVVTLDGVPVEAISDTVIIALNKPRGVTTTLSDPFAKRTITQYIPAGAKGLVPVGRLDKDSEGLLLMTNDGELVNKLTHPSFEHEKEYIVTTNRSLSNTELEKLAKGVRLAEGFTGGSDVTRLSRNSFSIILTQGWKRQIRRMVETVGAEVTKLQRVRIGKLSIDNLAPGRTKVVQENDII